MGKRVSTVLTSEQYRWVEEMAQGRGISMADMLRLALAYYMEEEVSLSWPYAKMEHGGRRQGSGRKKVKKDTLDNQGKS